MLARILWLSSNDTFVEKHFVDKIFVDRTFLRKILIFFSFFSDYMFYLVFHKNRLNSGMLYMEIEEIKEMLRIPEIKNI